MAITRFFMDSISFLAFLSVETQRATQKWSNFDYTQRASVQINQLNLLPSILSVAPRI
jgi:hypothetical protein